MRKKKVTKINEPETYAVAGFKGFDKNMQCRGFQFKEGETYTHNGTAKACSSGFHFCENPLDVFGYYEPGSSIYHTVTGSGAIDRHDEDSKIACTEIKIGLSLKLHDFIGSAIDFMFNRRTYDESGSKHGEGNSSASSATGYSSASSATGYSSASSATGDRSASSATGDSSAAVATGLWSEAMAGKYGCIALQWWNEKENRSEMRCAETGCGDGSDGKLKSDVWYRLNEGGEFEEVGS